jgi:glycosyltransferase involved in cell wall biosynthesis
VIERGVNGWVCEADDTAGLARLMREAGETVDRTDMATAVRASAERFGIDAMAARLVELYATLER